MRRFLENNGLVLALAVCFLGSITGHALSGRDTFNQLRQTVGEPALPLRSYLATGTFLDSVLVNWQAAVLQLASLVVFGLFLREHGAAHSARGPHPARHFASWVDFAHKDSLSLTLSGLFVLAFIAHIFTGAAAARELARFTHTPLPPAGFHYALSSQFWFTTLQSWQAEYFTIALYLVLSIFLRQQDSPESKPVQASDDATGESATE